MIASRLLAPIGVAALRGARRGAAFADAALVERNPRTRAHITLAWLIF